MRKKYLLVFLILIFISSFASFAKANTTTVFPYHRLVTNTLSYGYKNIISPVNQSSCSMYPTCSQYAINSFKKDSFLVAWLKTSDRLIRCSNDSHNYYRVLVNGMVRFYDPVDYKLNEYEFKNSNYKSFTLTKVDNGIDVPDNNPVQNVNANLLFEFAQNLEYEGQTEKAITEYKRLLSYYPKSAYEAKAMESIFRLLYKQEKYLEAIKWGKRILRKDNVEIDFDKLRYFMGCGYYRLENFDQAIKYFKELRNTANTELIARTYLLEGLSYVSQEKWDEAIDIFSHIDINSPYYDKSQEFISLSKEGKNLDLKDPKLAGTLAVIPGLGYLYSGYNEAARSSFFVNSLFIWATVKSFESGNNGLGSLLAVFSAGFYSGNIYGSVQTARRKNDLIKQEHIMKFDLDFKF